MKCMIQVSLYELCLFKKILLGLLTRAPHTEKYKIMNLVKVWFYSPQKSFCALQTIAPFYGPLYDINIQDNIAYSHFSYNWKLLEMWDGFVMFYFYHLML